MSLRKELEQDLTQRRAQYQRDHAILDGLASTYAQSVKVDFVAVLQRHFSNTKKPHVTNVAFCLLMRFIVNMMCTVVNTLNKQMCN